MKPTQAKIIKWIESIPTKQQIEKEAGLPQGYLTKCSKGEKNMRPATLEKVVKVIKKYGFIKELKTLKLNCNHCNKINEIHTDSLPNGYVSVFCHYCGDEISTQIDNRRSYIGR